MFLLDLPDDLLMDRVFRTVRLHEFCNVRCVCKKMSQLPWTLASRTPLRRPRNTRLSFASATLSHPYSCAVSHCILPCLTSIVWEDIYIPRLPYCRLHVDPYIIRSVDIYCHSSFSSHNAETITTTSNEASIGPALSLHV